MKFSSFFLTLLALLIPGSAVKDYVPVHIGNDELHSHHNRFVNSSFFEFNLDQLVSKSGIDAFVGSLQ